MGPERNPKSELERESSGHIIMKSSIYQIDLGVALTVSTKYHCPFYRVPKRATIG